MSAGAPSRTRGDVAAAAAGLAVLALALLYAPVIRDLIRVWTDVPYYSYGFLVPLFAVYLAWDVRRALAGPPAWRAEGLALMVTGIALLAAGAAIESLVVQTLSLPVALAGLTLFVLGPERTRVLAFPLAFLCVMTPLPDGWIPALSTPLQHLAARFAHSTLVLLGIPVQADGLSLHLRGITLHVTEACSGLRFLLAMAVIGIAYAWTTQTRALHRTIVIGGAVVLAILGNMVRVAGTAVLADVYGPEAAMGFFHLAYGKLVYAAMLVPFLAIVLLLRRHGRVTAETAAVPVDAIVPASVTAIVPTKNRPHILVDAIRALLAQTVAVDELIVVDQSDDETGRRLVESLVDGVPAERRPLLLYIWDRSITGLAAARNIALDRATGELVVFCDDDVLPEPGVIERLLQHYGDEPGLAGVAPVIVNYAPPSAVRRLHLRLFNRGPFRDERQPVYWFWRRYAPGTLIPVRMFTGAMMSFRRSALAGVRLDARFRGASVGEDVDLCWSVGARGGRLAISVDARIVHNRAPRPAR